MTNDSLNILSRPTISIQRYRFWEMKKYNIIFYFLSPWSITSNGELTSTWETKLTFTLSVTLAFLHIVKVCIHFFEMPNWPCHDDNREKEVFVLSCFVLFCIFEACTSYKTGASEGFYMWWTFIMFLNIVCINTVTQKISSKHCCFFSCVILLGHNKGVHHSPKWTIEVHFA